tara:strand:- start:26002 stop:26166 length:165 start_codon:yes stop_codon:yes gene_type:complete
MEPGQKEYLGDGVYIEFDGFGWALTAEQAHGTQRIYIDGPRDAKKLAQLMGVIK